jgi:hypothetical protein
MIAPSADDIRVDTGPRALQVVLAPGSRRAHLVATAGSVQDRSASPWEVGPVWSAVTTVCGRPGPFVSAAKLDAQTWLGIRLPAQDCGACWRGLGVAWDGYDA